MKNHGAGLAAPTPAQPAPQYFGGRGCFASYNARLEAPLTGRVARLWSKPVADPMQMMREVGKHENDATTTTATEFAELVGRSWPNAPTGTLTRGAACAWLLEARN